MTTIAEMRAARREAVGRVLGFVPTMGALHAGHASLLKRARQESSLVVVSVFVNPAQFGPHEDLQRYPRTLEADLELCRGCGVDVVFAPPASEMYPSSSLTTVEVADLSRGLCGRERPGHFSGVVLVVVKLFNIVQPHRAYFGQKDAQQAAIIRRMTRDLNFDLEIVVCPTVREPDGVALSSRNGYLSAAQRVQAASLHAALQELGSAVRRGRTSSAALIATARARIAAAGPCRIEYLELVDAHTLQPADQVNGPMLAVLAVTIGDCRLIDNLLIDEVPTKR